MLSNPCLSKDAQGKDPNHMSSRKQIILQCQVEVSDMRKKNAGKWEGKGQGRPLGSDDIWADTEQSEDWGMRYLEEEFSRQKSSKCKSPEICTCVAHLRKLPKNWQGSQTWSSLQTHSVWPLENELFCRFYNFELMVNVLKSDYSSLSSEIRAQTTLSPCSGNLKSNIIHPFASHFLSLHSLAWVL